MSAAGRPAALRAGVEGILHLEQAVTTIEWGEGLALRYGGFYGPGTGISRAPDAVMAAPIRKRQFPIVGDGGGVWSHIHIEDAATATTAAIEHGRPGVYYVVDDELAPVREWLPVLAGALDAKPPRRGPRWLARSSMRVTRWRCTATGTRCCCVGACASWPTTSTVRLRTRHERSTRSTPCESHRAAPSLLGQGP